MIIIGNAIMFIGSMLMIISGYIKSAKTTIFVQGIQMFLMGIGNLFLGSFPAAFTNFFSIFRNVACYKNKLGFKLKMFFVVTQTIIGIIINNLGLIGFFPIAASAIYTFFMGVDNDSKLKKVMIFTNILWLIHDFSIQSYVAIIFDILGIIACIITIFRLKKDIKEI